MRRALIYLHIAVFLAGFTGVLGRLIQLNEYLIVWYRLLIAVITMWMIFLWKRSLTRIPLPQLMRIFGVGAVVAFHWVFFYGSIKYANVSIALVCFSTLGFFSAILEPLFVRKRLSLTELVLGAMAIAGVYLIFHFDTRYKTGILLGIVSAILAALFTILNKKLLKTHPASTVTYFELMGGLVVLSLLLPVYLHLFKVPFELPSVADWVWLLILAWLCTVLAFYLSVSALRSVSSFTVNLSYNLEPVYGIALAFIVYRENEELNPSFYAGLGLIIAAVVVQTVRVRRSSGTRS